MPAAAGGAGARRCNPLRRVITIDMQGLGQVLFTVHEDEIKRFHLTYQEWIASDAPRRVFSFHMGHDTKFIRLDMIATYTISDEVMAQLTGPAPA